MKRDLTKRRSEAPDLQTQLEDLLHAVWEAEAGWELSDRIDLAIRRRSSPPRPAKVVS